MTRRVQRPHHGPDRESVSLHEWQGMVGHNWGTEHAGRGVWLDGSDPGGAGSGDYLDVGAGRVELGPVQTPWIANGILIESEDASFSIT